MTDKFHLAGLDLFGNPINPKPACKLAANFIVPPFSILNAREGGWQERKRQWISLGIQGEIGRARAGNVGESASLKGGTTWGCSFGPYDERKGSETEAGTSVFDPTLTELAYRWFCPDAGQIIDPFAGGSVRGIVAALLGYRYWGCDLRPEQIAANEQQACDICPQNAPAWVCGDAMDAVDTDAPAADFIFSCPPYGDLERYSDDPRDLSTMDYHAFIGAYRRIIARCAAKLRQDRFACFVVGDFRDPKTGNYRNFVGDTVESFRQCGMALYNEAILITCVGSLPIRVGKQFTAGRKLGKTHQNVLVFVKGDGKRAAQECGALAPEYEWI